MLEIKDKEEFFKLQNKLERIPFSQSKGWFDYVSHKHKDFVFFVDSLQEVKIACWGILQSVPLFSKKILRIDGECYSQDINEKVFKTFYTKLSKLPYTAIEINSNNAYNIDYEIGIRRSGFKRPLGYFSCPLTIEMDFNSDFKFNRNWKRNVKKTIDKELIFKEVIDFTPELLLEISEMFKEMADLKGLGFTLEPESLLTLLYSKDIRTFIVYNQSNTPVAARIIHFDKIYSSDVFAANSNEARNCGATYFIMQSIFEKLKKEGFKYFDFGRIPPSNHATDSIYTFKNASRGKKVQYNGEWVLYKSKYMELLMLFYKMFKLKKQRY
ncbi:MAG: hypothetical protein ACI93N_000298 [Flavobacteriaceae bacterium]|jgi:hypothetical protein